MHEEAKMLSFLLNNLLKVAENPEHKHNPRHYSKDPEYKYSNVNTKEFKRGIPAPDVNMHRPQGDAVPLHRGNFPNWRP